MSADGTLPAGVRHDDVSDRPRPWLDDEQPHHAGDDDMGPPDGPVLRRRPRPEHEPERLACRQCGKAWDEPRLSPDGVCPMCREALEER